MNAKWSKIKLRGALASALVLAICLPLLGVGPAGAAPSRGSGHHLTVSGHTLSGTFTLPAVARSKHAKVQIVLSANGHSVTVGKVQVPAGARARRPLSFQDTLPARLQPGRFRVMLCVSRQIRRRTVTTCSLLGIIQIAAPIIQPSGGTGTTSTATTPTSTTKTGTPATSTSTPTSSTPPPSTSSTPTTTSTPSTPTTPTTPTTPSTPTTPATTPPDGTPKPDGPTSPVWPVTTTTTNYGNGCSYPEITTVPAPPPQFPIDPQTVTPNAVVDSQPAPFFPDGLGQYECNANTTTLADSFTQGGYFTSGFFVNVPDSYNVNTPETLVVQMHGCEGTASSDVYNLSVNRSTFGALDNPYIMISLSGPEGMNALPDCWSTPADDFKVLYDIYLAETYFNIDRHRIILLGYSSGGDLGYSTIFHYADEFAGILGQNTNPWSQNDLWTGDETTTAQKAISMAAWPFNVLQVATSGDTVYPYMAAGGDPGVEPVISTMQKSGFPATLYETPGVHGPQQDTCDPQAADGGVCENPSDFDMCTPTSYDLCYGTYYDQVYYALATVADDGWESP